MHFAIARLPRKQRRAKARELARRSHAPGSLRDRRRREAGPDFATLVWRAKQDRRGTVLHTGHLYRGDGRVQTWQVRHSVSGRTDQFDVLLDGSVWRTGGPRLVRKWLPGFEI